MGDTPKRTDRGTSERTDLSTDVSTPSDRPLAPLSRGGSLLEQAINRLPAGQQEELLQKAVDKKIDLEVRSAEAQQAYADFAQETLGTIHQVQELGKTGMDVTATYEGRTASGRWYVEVRKSNYTVIIAVAAIIGIVLLIFALR